MCAAFYGDMAAELKQLRDADAFRSLRRLDRVAGSRVRCQGQELINCSSNDYLGIAQDPSVLSDFYAALGPETLVPGFGLGSTSSRLLTGNYGGYEELEDALAHAYGRESALVFNSGYHANLGILPALLDAKDVIFSDRLNHASVLDGARLSGAKLYRYNHLDLRHLEQLLVKHRPQYRRAVLVSESVFSMDGDLADLAGLAALRDRYDAFLYIDEAHAAGVFGGRGLGAAEAQACIPRIDLLLGTFGKAWGGMGAFSVCDQTTREYLINKMRPFIFTTALPPVVVRWNHFILERMPGWNARRRKVLELADLLRADLERRGLATGGQSQIVPVVIGSNADTVAAAENLLNHGLLLLPIRPPTVPAGSSRLRISLNASLSWEDIHAIPEVVQATLAHATASREAE